MSSSSSQTGGGSAPPMYFCHMCSMEMRPLMTPQPTCPRCNGGFVEEIDASSDLRHGGRAARGEGEEDNDGDDDDDENMPFWSGEPVGMNNAGPGFDIGQLMTTVLRNLANAGQDAAPNTDRRDGTNTDTHASDGTGSQSNPSASAPNSNIRFGSTRIGPVGVTWGMGSHTFSNNAATQTQDQTDHFHDDGMGGAGAAADGRFFNHDNNNNPLGTGTMPGSEPSSDEPNLPPELASLREIFGNLFGGINDGPAGSLFDMFGNVLRGRSGDYVFGQQGLDDVISQLMEQTRGSTAPPPASDEAIAKLARFSRKDVEKVREARNRECSTCMDSFEEEGSDLKPDASKDSNLPTGLSSTDSVADDPPESVPEEGQQDELVMMPCKHLFHEDCLIPWLKNSGTCPVCRVSLEPKKEQENPDSTEAGPSTSTFSRVFATQHPSVNTNRPVSSSGVIEEREDTDFEDDDEMEDDSDQRRERMRRAAEARASQNTNSIPGSFLPPADDLD